MVAPMVTVLIVPPAVTVRTTDAGASSVVVDEEVSVVDESSVCKKSQRYAPQVFVTSPKSALGWHSFEEWRTGEELLVDVVFEDSVGTTVTVFCTVLVTFEITGGGSA